MHISIGKLKYSDNPNKLIVAVDNEIGNYYRSLIPKYYRYQKPLYDSHISVVRNEKSILNSNWNKYQDMEVEFQYDVYIYNYGVYFWLNARSNFLKRIRLELGLEEVSEYTKSPNGNSDFHITIANIKHLNV